MTDPSPDNGSRPLRVLHVIKGLNSGGAEHLLVLAAHYRDRKRFHYEVAYLLPGHVDLAEALAAEDVPLTCLAANRWWDPRWPIRLRRQLRRQPADVVHAHSPMVATGARLAVRSMPRAQRPAMVVTLHNMWRSHRLVVRAIDRATYRLDDVRLAVSDAVRRSLPRRAAQRAITLIHGIDIDRVAATADRTGVRRELGVGDDEILVGTVANLRATKGYPDLLAAAQLVIDAHPSVRFVAIGQGPQRDALDAQLRASGLGDRFQFLGYRPDATRLMSGFDLFCLSSHHEGLPIALLEALVQAIPVVSTDVGGISEVVTSGREGVLVPAGNPEVLAETLAALATDGDRRRAYSTAAAQRGATLDAATATATVEEHYWRVVR